MLKPAFFFVLVTFIGSIHCYAQSSSRMTVYFDSDKSLIRTDTKDSLEKLSQAMHSPGKITQIEIIAHCDGRGTNKYNQALSSRRALAIEEHLRSTGLNTDIPISKQSMGESALINADQTKDEQALNRRAEIILHFTPLPAATPVEIVEKKDSVKTEQAIVSKQDSVIIKLFDPLKYDSMKVGDQLVLENINFQPGRHFLIEWSVIYLEKLLGILKDHPTLKIEIQGHICCINTGADGPDLDLGTNNLSEERAKTVYRYLIDNGIKKSRLSYKGFGSSQKLYPAERTERERSLNRRVEIKVITK